MGRKIIAAAVLSLIAQTTAQQIGTDVPEVHPQLQTQVCTAAGGCVTKQTFVVSDALSRSLHAVGQPDIQCANPINTTLCPDAATCAKNCVLEGLEYGSRGVLASGSALTLRQYLFDGTAFQSVSPRLYLLAEDGLNYEALKLVGQEFTFDVDLSQLGCGMNGALYLSEMDASGSRSDLNPAGAQYGTGYCDAQCFNVSFINGLPNLNNSGACCNEMDLWEANSVANAMTPHTCSSPGSFLCSGDECGQTGVCDKSGCGLNPFALGAKSFYGPEMTVDTSRPFTVVTQFISNDNTTTGTLSEIRRLYVQDSTVFPNPVSGGTSQATRAGETTITQDFCTAHNASEFNKLGGIAAMGESLARGMVLVFSIWNSNGDFMNWLDSGNAGPCNATAGDPASIVAQNPEVAVTFSNIRWGDIGSTFNGTVASTANRTNQNNSHVTGSAVNNSPSIGAGARLAAESIFSVSLMVLFAFVL